MTWKIAKLGYSRSPWRIVKSDGLEVATTCSRTGIQGPICGQTRSEVEAWLLDRCEWYAMNARAGMVPPIYSPNWRTTAKVDSAAKVSPPRLTEASET